MFTRLPSRRRGHAGPGFDESFVVAVDFGRQPVRAWSCADHGKHSRRSNVSAFVVLRIFQLNFFKFFPAKHLDRKSTRLNSSHANISYAVFCLKKKKTKKYI